MIIEKKFVPKIEIYTGTSAHARAEGQHDLTKKWFVYYKEPDQPRKRIYGRVNRLTTIPARLRALEKLRKKVAAEYVPPPPPPPPLHQKLIDKFNQLEITWKPKTVMGNRSILNAALDWFAAERKEITAETMLDYFRIIQHTKAGATYKAHRSFLKRMFTEIGEEGITADVPVVKAYSVPARYYQKAQIRQLKAVISACDPELWLYCQFVYYCFLRPGDELRHVRAGDVQLDDAKILVRGATSKNKRQLYVAIPDAFLPRLQYIEEMRPDAYLFPGKHDSTKPIGVNTMSNRHRKIIRSLGYTSDYKLYSWKHTGAVQAVKAGIGLKELQIQLRHHSLDMVEKYLRQLGVQDLHRLKRDFPAL